MHCYPPKRKEQNSVYNTYPSSKKEICACLSLGGLTSHGLSGGEWGGWGRGERVQGRLFSVDFFGTF